MRRILGLAGDTLEQAKLYLGIDKVAEAVLAAKLTDLSQYYEKSEVRETVVLLAGWLRESCR